MVERGIEGGGRMRSINKFMIQKFNSRSTYHQNTRMLAVFRNLVTYKCGWTFCFCGI